MAGPDPHGDQRIEELLSQLQGIFSKLSTTEQAEAKEKENLPPNASAPPLIEHFSEPEPVALPVPPPEAPAPIPVASPPPTPAPAPAPAPPPVPVIPAPAEPTPSVNEAPPPVATPDLPAEPPAPVESAPAIVLSEPPVDDEHTVRVAICYPEGNENEVKVLSQKLETLSPKFTKVAFKLAVCMATSYKPKVTDWSEEFFTQAQTQNIRAYFFVVPRPMEESKRKALALTLEKFGIYYQEVPLISIEKRAFYMDLLLGLVFFFDSHGLSPKPPAEGT